MQLRNLIKLITLIYKACLGNQGSEMNHACTAAGGKKKKALNLTC